MSKKINFKHSDETLKKTFKSIHAYDLAMLYPSLDDIEKKRMVDLIYDQKFWDMFVELEHEDQVEIINKVSKLKQKQLLRNLESDDLKEFIEDLSEENQETYLNQLTKVKAKTIRLLLKYEENHAASMMTTDFITIQDDMTIKSATDQIIRNSQENDYIDTIFVTSKENVLIGKIEIRELIIARANQDLKDIMKVDFHFVYENDTIEKAIDLVQNYDRNAIPVLDIEKHMIGIITADDIFDELIEDYDDDYQRYSLVQDHLSSNTSLQRSRQRLPWLFLAVILNIITITILSMFEATLEEITVLILFQPMILAMAGNIGTQSLAVTILGISQDTLNHKEKMKKHVFKEFSVGLLNSTILAVLAFIIVFSMLSIIKVGNQKPMDIARIVFLSIFAAMTISSLMGSLVPLIFHKYKIDPASASGPIMTTINDIVALVTYFGIATITLL